MTSGYRITVIEPNGVQRALPLQRDGLVVGRGTENGLTINYPDISRRHTYISFDGGQCYVTDLESGNGTYLGSDRLTPQEPTPWAPGTPLRLGGVTIQLVQEHATGPHQAVQPPPRPGNRQREQTDTVIGIVAPSADTKGSKRWVWIAAILLLGSLCVCLAAGGAGGYLFYGA